MIFPKELIHMLDHPIHLLDTNLPVRPYLFKKKAGVSHNRFFNKEELDRKTHTERVVCHHLLVDTCPRANLYQPSQQ